jgi:hypothetical protein
LDLSGTKITDVGFKELAGLQQLEWLELDGTRIGDASLKVLAGFKQLELLSLFNTQVTREGAGKLQKVLPRCKIDHGAN